MNLAALGGALQGFNSKFDSAAIMQAAQARQAQAALIASLLQNGGTTGGAPPVPGASPSGPLAGPTSPPVPSLPPSGGMPPQAPAGSPGMSGGPGAPSPVQGGGDSPPAALPGGGAPPMPGSPGAAPGALPPTPAAAGGGQLSGVAAGTQDPVMAMRQTLKTMAQQIAAANPKMKGSQLFGAMQQELSLMKGVEPAVKDAMTQYIEAQKLNAKYAGLAQAFQVGMAKVQSAKSIAEMQAATKQMIEDAHERFGIEIQDMKDTTAEDVAETHKEGTVEAAGEHAGATVQAATIGANSREVVGAGHDKASITNTGTKVGGALGVQDRKNQGAAGVAETNRKAKENAAALAAGKPMPYPATPPTGAKRAPDGHMYAPDPKRPGKFLKLD